MSTEELNDEGIGRTIDAVDGDQPDADAVAAAMGFEDVDQEDVGDVEQEAVADAVASDGQLTVSDLLAAFLRQQQEINELRERLDRVEETADDASDVAEEAADEASQAAADAAESESTTKEVAAAVNALQDDERDESGDEGGDAPRRSHSLMDLYQNCQQYHCQQELYANEARAVEIVRRRDEFAQRGRSHGRYVFEKDDVATALTAILGEKPHRETIHRVWNKMDKLGGRDVYEASVQVGTSDTKKDVLRIDPKTSDRFDEGRYFGMNLLGSGATVGRVTPVVTEVEA